MGRNRLDALSLEAEGCHSGACLIRSGARAPITGDHRRRRESEIERVIVAAIEKHAKGDVKPLARGIIEELRP
jgi:hypothetical protein